MENVDAVRAEQVTLAIMGPLLRARIAGQAGLVTRAQAIDGGLTAEAIEWQIRRGRWVRVIPGIYQTLAGRDDWETRAVAALLHAGKGAALFGRSAGYVWGLVRSEPETIEIVIPADRRVRAPGGVAIRRSRTLGNRVHPTEWPHRVVVEHTVLDITDGGTFDRAVSLAAKAIDLKVATPESLRAALDSRPRQSFPGSWSRRSATWPTGPRVPQRSGTSGMSSGRMDCPREDDRCRSTAEGDEMSSTRSGI